jgi:hypothetical protein
MVSPRIALQGRQSDVLSVEVLRVGAQYDLSSCYWDGWVSSSLVLLAFSDQDRGDFEQLELQVSFSRAAVYMVLADYVFIIFR